jgi:hypothetical protein
MNVLKTVAAALLLGGSAADKSPTRHADYCFLGKPD